MLLKNRFIFQKVRLMHPIGGGGDDEYVATTSIATDSVRTII